MLRRGPLYVAMHEAGHAVAMLANSPSPHIRYVSVGSGEQRFEGYTAAVARFQPSFYDHEVGMDDKLRQRLRRNAWLDVLDALAGPIAEGRFKRISTIARTFESFGFAKLVADPDVKLDHGEDADLVRRRLSWLDAARIDELFRNAWAETEVLLSSHWKRVDDLGRWLNVAKRIEGDELREWWGRNVF